MMGDVKESLQTGDALADALESYIEDIAPFTRRIVLRKAAAALRSRQQVADGFVMVPVVPAADTLNAMLEAFGSGAGSSGEHTGHDIGDAIEAYRAILADKEPHP